MALSAARNALPPTKGPTRKRSFRMANSITIYAGELIMIASTGLANACAASALNRGIIAVAVRTKVSGTGGADYVEGMMGTFELPGTSLTQAMVGTLVFGQADSTIGATGTNLPIAGLLEDFVSATLGRVAIGSEYLT